jgi:L,D-transpeptidase catalytic domain
MLIAAGTAALMVAGITPAAAYQGWSLFGPVAQPQPEPVFVPRRHSKRDKARKFIADQIRVPEKLPPGPLQIVISVRKQQLTLYAGGQAVAHSQVSTGVPGHPTPQGVFSIIQKQIYHESNIYSAAPMPYMQRITWSGVAMHQGVVPNHPASHGCIRLPPAFAKRLWSLTKVGVRVLIAQDDIPLTEIVSPRLLALAPAAKVSEAPATRVRYATVESVSDAPLKGSIDARNEAQVENAIDRMVQAGMAAAEAPAVEDEDKLALAPEKIETDLSAKDPLLRPGPISVFISRKAGRIFVRKGFDEVFDAAVTIAEPNRPLGTHVFTAFDGNDAQLRWNVASLPTERTVKPGKYLMTTTARGEKLRKELVAPEREVLPPGNPNDALERITIPEAALARIAELMSAGASVIVSDLAYSYETGRGTDFIVLTR